MTVSQVEYQELIEEVAPDAAALAPNLELLEHVDVTLEVKIGTASLSVAELFALKAGSLVVLAQRVDEPVEVFLNGRLVAAGHLAVSGDQLGVRITNIANSGKQLTL